MSLTDLETRILRDLRDNGDNVPAALSDNVDAHRKSVSRCLGDLVDAGAVERKNQYGVYRITSTGRDALESMDAIDDALAD